jgi:ADP-heptose:LPS heptosyltransferase
VLANSYNAPVLERNPDVSAVVSYRKLKHLGAGESALAALGQRLQSFWQLRQMKLDCVVLATPGAPTRGLRLARWLRPARIVRFDDGTPDTRHEVELVFSLAKFFGIEGAVPKLVLVPDPGEIERARALLAPRPGRRIAVHISARRPAQRWPAPRFAELIRRLHAEHGAQVLLLWSPGRSDDPQHPGDDDKAAEVLREIRADGAAIPYPTARLAELIGALAACDEAIVCDGGAMHLAAALGKPIVALFGDSPVERWRPWGTRHRVVRPASRNLSDLPVEEVLAAYRELAATEA